MRRYSRLLAFALLFVALFAFASIFFLAFSARFFTSILLQRSVEDWRGDWRLRRWTQNLIEATDPNAFSKSSRRRRVPTEQWKGNRWCSIALKTTLAWHSSRTIVWDTLAWHSCGILLWGNHVGHFYGTLLWDTLAWHSCSTLLWHTLVKHSLSILWNTLVRHSCWILLIDTSETPRKTTLYYKASTQYLTVLLYTANLAQSNSRCYFVLRILHKPLPSTTLCFEACTRHLPQLLRTPDSTLHT